MEAMFWFESRNQSIFGLSHLHNIQERLKTLKSHFISSSQNLCRHFSTVLIKTYWYTASCKFYGCRSLASIHLPDTVTTIGNSAFRGCSSLTSIHLPNSVTTIGGYAFGECCFLKSIHISDSVTKIGDDAFSCCCFTLSIYIPKGTKEKLKELFKKQWWLIGKLVEE